MTDTPARARARAAAEAAARETAAAEVAATGTANDGESVTEDKASTTGNPPASAPRAFLGGRDNPLLAPRGVHLCDGRLIVADTGQNRVFIWNTLPTGAEREPDVVLGQVVTTDTARNSGGAVSASTLQYPSGLWSDGRRLIVCDAWNHRVLIWNTFPTAHGQAADLVLGQPDFTGNQPNAEGVGATPSARTLNWPYGVDVDGDRILVADTGNRRVLVFGRWPTESYAAADVVIGQSEFDERDYDPKRPIWPYSVKVGPSGAIAIVDTQYYRVLLYPSLAGALDPSTRPTIIGQEGREANGQNQFRWFPEPFTLNWCYDACFHESGLFVADTGNSRVLYFDALPTTDNASANALLGQASWQVGIENRNSITATPESMYWPFHLSIDGDTMAVADTGNHRVVLYELRRSGR